MARINLLPWREERRKRKQQEFLTGIGVGALATVLILFFVYLYIDGMKGYQDRRNQMLRTEIAALDRQIAEIKDIETKKNRLLTKIDVIHKLQESRPEIVHLFDELTRVTPEGVFLTQFTQIGASLNMEGKAESNARVSAFMRAIEKSDWLNSPVLGVIKGQGRNSGVLNDFSLIASQGKKTDNNTGAAQ
jgi:type IV pilus assembly protein PilN